MATVAPRVHRPYRLLHALIGVAAAAIAAEHVNLDWTVLSI
jgi:hypothetical protein